MHKLTPAEQLPVELYHLAERSFIETEHLHVKGDLPRSAWHQADVSAQFAYDCCIEAGINPFTNKQLDRHD